MTKAPDDLETTARLPLDRLTAATPPADERRGATLTCLTSPRLGFVHRLGPGSTVIGRTESADFQLTLPGVSRRHAMITEEEGTYTLTDLGSTNGTYCRGVRVEAPMALKDRDTLRLGANVMLRFAFHDALEEKMGAELYERATRDPLTTARNRRYFTDRLESEWPWARRHDRACALLMLDLDHFKQINDRWGHLAGDHVLREFVKLAFAELRQEDLFGRLGGEEFAVLCRATAASDASILAERLRARAETHHFMWNGERLPVSVSIGIATSAELDVSSTDDLLRRADERLYDAKHEGRNRVVGPARRRAADPGGTTVHE